MEWYVLNYNFNKKQIENFNIFRSVRFTEGLEELLNNFVTFDNFVENLDKLLIYSFWCKAEYEIMVGGLFNKENEYEKIDIYSQLKPNIKILAEYIINEHNKNI